MSLRAPFPRRHAITRSPSRAFSSFRLLCADQCAVSARAIVLSLSLSLLSRPLLLFKNFSLLTSPTSSSPPCSAHMCSTSSYVLGPPSLPWAIALALHRGTLDLRRVYAMSARTTARGAGARSAGERASARISAGGADARSAGGRASARTSASGANARSAGGGTSARTSARGANARSAGEQASARTSAREANAGAVGAQRRCRAREQSKGCAARVFGVVKK